MEAQTVQKKLKPTVTPGGKTRGRHYEGQHAHVQSILHANRIQPKLRVGQPNDKYEQEADRVAEQVMRMPDPKLQRQPENEAEEETLQPKPLAGQIRPLIQRQVEPEEEEELIQPGYDHELEESNPIMESVPTRDAGELGEEEEELIQTKPLADKPGPVTADLHSKIQSLKGGGQMLPASERAFFEPRFGADFSNVRVHNDNRAGLIARSINARAFTLGRDVVFGAEQYSPGSRKGRSLLAHELTHIVQQGGGRTSSKAQHRESIESDPIDADVGCRNVYPMAGQFESRGGYGSAITAGDVTQPGPGIQPTTVQLSPAPAGKSSKATPPKLSKQKVVGPMDTIDCGGYYWAVKWNLDKSTTKGGYVVQMVASWVNVKDCKGQPVRVQDRVREYNPKNYPFWESWKIGKNQTGTGKSRDDSYTWLQGVGEGTKGFIQVRGYATFYEGLTLPSSFKVVPNSPAQLAPMTRTNPNLPHGTDTVLHTLTASWDCCPGSKSKKTKLKAR